ncbi:MAG: sulfite exporter TauE/SafE family protein [Gemmatimonadota bacterium]
MPDPTLWAVAAAILVVAALYASVGHGGASGYIAVMALAGIAPAVLRPSALALNVIVSSLAGLHFWRAGHFRWRLLWPFAITSIPAAFLGGWLTLPDPVYKRLVGGVLLVAAGWLFRTAARPRDQDVHPPPVWVAAGFGVVLGLLAGLTGVGGGIFLSPLLLAAGWAGARETAAVSAVFILVNSLAGLAAQPAALSSLPAGVALWAGAALTGGVIGARLGSRRLGGTAIRRLLAGVLVLAGIKFLFLI